MPSADSLPLPFADEPSAGLPDDLALSVVIPLNNEQANVRPLLTEVDAALRDVAKREIVIVDDGSDDATAEEVRRVGREIGRVRLLRHKTRRGQSTAVYNGIRAAKLDVIATLDGDLQNDPRDVVRLLARYYADSERATLGLVIGHRVQRRDSGLRRWSSRIANAVRSRALGDDTPDTGCGLKVFRRAVFLGLPYFDHMHRFLPALMLRAGYRVVSEPVSHRPRIAARAHYGMWDRAWVGLVDLFGVAWLIRRSRPLDSYEEPL
jgi:glycosyltransferase involved in cell wall biosynthesis